MQDEREESAMTDTQTSPTDITEEMRRSAPDLPPDIARIIREEFARAWHGGQLSMKDCAVIAARNVAPILRAQDAARIRSQPLTATAHQIYRENVTVHGATAAIDLVVIALTEHLEAKSEKLRLSLERETRVMREALETLAETDGSPGNVASAEILAARVRNCARQALNHDAAKPEPLERFHEHAEEWTRRVIKAGRAALAGESAPTRDAEIERLQAGVYVASRASVPARSEMWRRLRSEGFPIISTWIDEAGEGETQDFGELWTRIAREIASARGLVLYAEPGDFPLKGALIEVGLALGMGKPVGVVLPGVELDGRTLRPVGSWFSHHLVCGYETVEGALIALSGITYGDFKRRAVLTPSTGESDPDAHAGEVDHGAE
jgi:hypothetical protein